MNGQSRPQEGLAQRYATVRAAIPSHVTLVAVSKKRSADEIQALYDLGHRDFGENYVQELRAKQPVLPADIRWHFIGHLQRSNVKHIVPFIHLIHGVDGLPVLDEIQKRAAAADWVVDALLQVHIAQEDTKHGLSPAEASELVQAWPADRLDAIRLRGLMGMATLTDDHDQVKAEFEGLARLFRQLRSGAPQADRFDVLSMGMSGDLAQALAAGSTMVRVGTALFGARD